MSYIFNPLQHFFFAGLFPNLISPYQQVQLCIVCFIVFSVPRVLPHFGRRCVLTKLCVCVTAFSLLASKKPPCLPQSLHISSHLCVYFLITSYRSRLLRVSFRRLGSLLNSFCSFSSLRIASQQVAPLLINVFHSSPLSFICCPKLPPFFPFNCSISLLHFKPSNLF